MRRTTITQLGSRSRRRYRRACYGDRGAISTPETLALTALAITLAILARGALIDTVTSQGNCIKRSVGVRTPPKC